MTRKIHVSQLDDPKIAQEIADSLFTPQIEKLAWELLQKTYARRIQKANVDIRAGERKVG